MVFKISSENKIQSSYDRNESLLCFFFDLFGDIMSRAIAAEALVTTIILV